MDNRPIGVFDSGLGGLTAMRELIRTLPNESILYFGDTGRVPYGSRGREIIRKYAKQDMNFLIRHDVKAVLAACGTVSSVARDIGDALPVPYFDVLCPTARAAVEQTKNGKIGIIGTAATIASGSYRKEIERLAPKTEVFEQACPLFVPLVENAFVSPDDPIPRLTAERYLTPIREAGEIHSFWAARITPSSARPSAASWAKTSRSSVPVAKPPKAAAPCWRKTVCCATAKPTAHSSILSATTPKAFIKSPSSSSGKALKAAWNV